MHVFFFTTFELDYNKLKLNIVKLLEIMVVLHEGKLRNVTNRFFLILM